MYSKGCVRSPPRYAGACREVCSVHCNLSPGSPTSSILCLRNRLCQGIFFRTLARSLARTHEHTRAQTHTHTHTHTRATKQRAKSSRPFLPEKSNARTDDVPRRRRGEIQLPAPLRGTDIDRRRLPRIAARASARCCERGAWPRQRPQAPARHICRTCVSIRLMVQEASRRL
jgi:hypothetical protein